MIRRFLLSAVLLIVGFAHADWAADRDGSAGYVTVTTLATAVDEAVPFVVVYLSDLPSSFHTAMSDASDTDGKTIRVSNSDGTTQLACVPIGVNTGTDTGCLIFLGTGMSASVDVDYRIYVGNASLSMPTASGGMGEQAVFASYAGVYFPGVATRDWTSGGRTLTAVNTPGTAASGYEGITAATYNGTTQYHKYEGTQAISAWPWIAEALVYADTSTADMCVAGYGTATSVFYSTRMGYSSTSRAYATAYSGGSSRSATTSTTMTDATWNYVAGGRTAATSGATVAYHNGGNVGSNTNDTGTSYAWNRLGLGAWISNSTVAEYFDGGVAVVLFSSSIRSADYVATMEDNWAGALYSAGAWTANDTCNSGSTGWVLFGTVGQSVSGGADWATLTNALDDDADAATVSLDDGGVYESEYLNFTNITYGTQPPVGADSYTITGRIKRTGQTSSAKEINDLTVQFIDETGTRVGTNVAATAVQWPSTAASVDYSFTGFTPDGGDFDADSGISLRATGINTNGATTASVLTVWIKIDWDCGEDPLAGARGFFALTE